MKNAEKGYRLCVPYPHPVRPERPLNPQMMYRLRMAAAGPEGVMTALSRALQRAAVCRSQMAVEPAELFEAGAQTALCHLRLLSEMLACCGADPALFVPKGGHKIWWSASPNQNVQKIDLLIKSAVQDAACACAAYRSLLAVLPAGLQPCVERMLADAQHQEALLRDFWLRL